MNDDMGRLAAEGVWEKVLKLVGECKEKVLLDAPAGGGTLSDKVRNRGGQIYSLDISPDSLRKNNGIQADLNSGLPFKKDIFDIILCVEGIEHLENPSALLREFVRVLNNGGTLILTTPNILNIRSRIKFALTGCLFWFGEYAIERYGHITPLSIYQLKHLCRVNNLEVAGIYINKTSFWMKLLSPVFMITGIMFKEKYNQADILSGEILILELVRTS